MASLILINFVAWGIMDHLVDRAGATTRYTFIQHVKGLLLAILMAPITIIVQVVILYKEFTK